MVISAWTYTSFCALAIFSKLPQALTLPSTIPAANYQAYDYGMDRSLLAKRQYQSYATYAITGVHTGSGVNGSLPLRQEVRELEENTDLWTLYILGLDMMQGTDQNDLLSWYQIAGWYIYIGICRRVLICMLGIHGRPYLPWDHSLSTPNNNNNGYCTHVSILFLPWHRPYLALYEVCRLIEMKCSTADYASSKCFMI